MVYDAAVTNQTPQPNPLKAPEILAPAGGREQFFAALNAGADAVYLGLKTFNARARAENFTPDDLRELVPLAHEYGMQVLVTLNILIKDQELKSLLATLSTLEDLEVDAIIVQDLAVASIVRRFFPALRLHASTQLAVHNAAGVKQAQALGFRRVVLARELTAQELRHIRAEIPRDQVEIEAFCHGSLCYSYSGLCFFSGAGDARSGNRGECAYTCRQPYKIISEPGHGFLFSMKDLDTSAHLDLLIKAGIDTLKIEGRKKDAQYVSSVVRLYRQRLDALYGASTLRPAAPKTAVELNHIHADQVPVAADLALSFQRQPTSLFVKSRYLENVIDLDNPTHAGVPLGRIVAVRGPWVSVDTEVALERFDGLRLVPQQSQRVSHALPQDGRHVSRDPGAMLVTYGNQHLEFSLRDMRQGNQRLTEAAPGSRVEIELPKDAPPPSVGDLLFKIRSADLKRRVTQLTVPPQESKLKAVRLIDIVITASSHADQVTLIAEAFKFGDLLASAQVLVPMVTSTGQSTLKRDAHQLFQLLGDFALRAKSVTYAGDDHWFVPRSLLKQLKHKLGEAVHHAYAPFIAARLSRAEDQLIAPRGMSTKVPQDKHRSFAVKSDRLETLRQAVAFAKRHPAFNLSELVFEPKRAFLDDLSPAALAGELADLAKSSALTLRLALPTVIRAWDEALLKRWFAAALNLGLRHIEIGNIGALELLRSWGIDTAKLDIASDFTLYALNSVATRFWQAQGVSQICLSIEDDRANLKAHLEQLSECERSALQVILYKDTPLFIAEACSLTALHGGCPTAKVCGYRTLVVENPKGERFHVAHESCKSIVYGEQAFSWTAEQAELAQMGIGRFRLDFLTRPYDEDALGRVLSAATTRSKVATTHGANFDRVLL